MTTETKPKSPKARIYVTNSITQALMKEFDVADNTIRVALKFYSESDLSKKIRSRAIELMDDVNKTNTQLIQEYDQD